jgi:uncharacterized protein with HEPN domain
MPRSHRLYLLDIQTALRRIDTILRDLDEASFKAGVPQTDGILFNLMTIGEAAKQIPQAIREQSPEIDWSGIGRFRDVVVHHYFSLDMEKVWEIVQTDLPPLRQQVEALLLNLKDDDDGEK